MNVKCEFVLLSFCKQLPITNLHESDCNNFTPINNFICKVSEIGSNIHSQLQIINYI